MRARIPAIALLLSTAVVTACATAPDDGVAEETTTARDALARRAEGVLGAPKGRVADEPDAGGKPPGRKPGLFPAASTLGGVKADTLAPSCADKRIDLRRKTRTCEDLPGAYEANGEAFVPGTGGRFRVTRLLAGTSAPAALQEKACVYTWEPDACAAPDTARLLVDAEEDPASREDSCLTNPALCRIVAKLPATKPPSAIPNGPGRCEVCGYASNDRMWVVLPATWLGFSYALAGETTRHVFLEPSDAAAVVEVELGHAVADQDVSIQLAIE